jgi:putative endopeptidase
LTLSENIGDLVGLSMAHTAYLRSLGGSEPPVVDGRTGVQRFFLSWAYRWRHKARDTEVARQLATDPHCPPEIRCNAVVRHLDAFHEAFDVREGDGMWLPPNERVRIW